MASSTPEFQQEYQHEFYISAVGIARDVITSDICRFLGNNAYIMHPVYDDQRNITGYKYKAYRAFTDEMVRSMQENTNQWRMEKENNRQRTGQAGLYENSRSRQQAPYDIPSHSNQRHATMPSHEAGYTLSAAVPAPAAATAQPPDRFVTYNNGHVYDNLTKQWLAPTAHAPVATPMETPRTLPNVAPTAPSAAPVPGIPDEYWTVDASGRRCYVRNGRIISYA